MGAIFDRRPPFSQHRSDPIMDPFGASVPLSRVPHDGSRCLYVYNLVVMWTGKSSDTQFNAMLGLDRKPASISLELGSKPSCSLVVSNGVKVQVEVGCRKRDGSGNEFEQFDDQ